MAVLKYWSTQNRWEIIGPPPPPTGYIQPTGGTVTGNLVVNTGQPGEAQIITNGTVQAPALRGGVFDGNIGLTVSRPVTLGGARGQKAADPRAGNSAATKKYIDGRARRAGPLISAQLTSSWTSLANHSAPGYRKDGSGKYVMMQGVLVTTTQITPAVGAASPLLFTLPDGFRPPKQIVFAIIGIDKSMLTCDVFGNGQVRLATGPVIPQGSWVSLDGCRFLLS